MRYGGIALTLIAGLAACGEPTQLYITHNTVLGLDAAVDTNRQAGRLLFGYDRQFIALAPRSVPVRKRASRTVTRSTTTAGRQWPLSVAMRWKSEESS